MKAFQSCLVQVVDEAVKRANARTGGEAEESISGLFPNNLSIFFFFLVPLTQGRVATDVARRDSAA